MPMASVAGRRLAELLQEQQEAFVLDVYLIENGYSGRILCSEATATCWPAGTACRRLQRLAGHGFQRRGEGILGSLVGVFARRRPPKPPNWRRGAPKDGGSPSRTGRKAHPAREDGGELGKIKVDAGRPHGWEGTDEGKELSPMSVLELQSDDDSPAHDHPKEEEPSTSGLHAQVGAMEAPGGLLHGSASSSHMGTCRKESHARRQALSACLKEGEVEEERSHQDLHESLGSRRRVSARRRQVQRAGDAMAAASHLTEPDVVPEYDAIKRKQFKSHVMEIGAEVGDSIVDELIEDLVLLTHI